MMLKRKFRVIHGWVVGVRQEVGTGRRMIVLRQSSGREFGLPARLSLMTAIGHLVSVALDCGSPWRMLAFVDHTTCEGQNFMRNGDCAGIGHWITLVGSASLFAAVAALGEHGFFVQIPLAAACWVVTAKVLTAVRLRASGRIDFLIDREYGVWRQTLRADHDGGRSCNGVHDA